MQKAGKTARAHLKIHTHGAHQRLHELPHFARLHHGTSSLENYAELMAALHAFYTALDARIASACRQHLDATDPYTYQPRAPLIEADLEAVHRMLPQQQRTRPAVLAPVLPVIESKAELAGVIYVVDGATLGGRLLNMSSGKLLGSEEAGGRSYWQWCERHGAQQWKAALALVEVNGRAPSHRRDMTNAASATFEALEKHFTDQPTVDLAGVA